MKLGLLLVGLKGVLYVTSGLRIQLLILAKAVVKILPERAAYSDQCSRLVPVVFSVPILFDHALEIRAKPVQLLANRHRVEWSLLDSTSNYLMFKIVREVGTNRE